MARTNRTPAPTSLYDEAVALQQRAADESAAHMAQIAYHEAELVAERARLATTTKIETTLQGLFD